MPLSYDEIRQRLIENIEPKTKRSFWKNQPTKFFEGYFDDNRFQISRIIQYRNSFLPIIEGNISKVNLETQIEVKMKLNLLIQIFLLFFIIPVFTTIFVAFTQIKDFDAVLLIPFAIFFLVYGMVMFGFKLESKRSKEELKSIFEAQILKE